jgi:dTDP-4-amino-4,6-dideoxygalactose transaminase
VDRLDITRERFIDELRRRDIGASVHFISIPLMKFLEQYASLPHNRCPRALELYPRLGSLPLYPAMTPVQMQHVAESVKDIVATARRTRLTAVPSVTEDVLDA